MIYINSFLAVRVSSFYALDTTKKSRLDAEAAFGVFQPMVTMFYGL